jgi:hypothetical protein
VSPVLPLSDRCRRRWDFEPLLERAGWDCAICGHTHRGTKADKGRCVSLMHLAQRIGVDDRACWGARREGLTDLRAERWAWAMGWYPHEVWGWDWFERPLIADELRERVTEAREARWARVEAWRRSYNGRTMAVAA